LALVEITDTEADVPAMGLAAVDRDSVSGDPVERCHVIGYPAFMERDVPDGGRLRETADAFGRLPVLSGLAKGLLSIQVSSAPRTLPPGQTALGESEWSGMSGGPVVADGLLLGVVTEHAPRAGPSEITATPLTALETDPKHPGWGPGVADPGAWWARLGRSRAQALPRLPGRRQRAEPAYWTTVREIHQRTEILLGRQRELADIASFATGPEDYRWLTGGAWAGKTSLLAEAVTAPPEQTDVVCYFLSRREAEADSSRFLAAVVPQLACLLGEDPPDAQMHQFRALWQRAAQRADTEDRQLLLVVDGLDEDLRPPGTPSVAALLPPQAGGRAHVLVSSRPYPELPADLPPGHPLTHTQPVEIEPFEGGRKLAELARQEIAELVRRSEHLAIHMLGLLAAAAGPLAVGDLIRLSHALGAPSLNGPTPPLPEPSLDDVLDTDRFLTDAAARSLQQVGTSEDPELQRYQYAHQSLLEYAQKDRYLGNRRFRDAIHRWARRWGDAGWPVIADGRAASVPRYLLANYPSTLAQDQQRLAALVSDVGWVEAAICSVGVDRVLVDLRQAAAANPASTAVKAVLAALTGQAHNLRPPQPLNQPGYILRQLWMQAAELTEDDLAEDICSRLQSRCGHGPVPRYTTRRTSRALSDELGRHVNWVGAAAVLADGRVVTGGHDGRVLVWDPARPGAGPAELGRHDGPVEAAAVLADGRVVTGGHDGRVLVWNPARLGAGPAELGRHDGPVGAAAGLAHGRLVTGGHDRRVLVWDPAHPGAGPAELGRHYGPVEAAAVLADGRVVTGGHDGLVLVWDPAYSGASPAELGRHDGWVRTVAVLTDGRVVTGGDDGRVLVWDPARPGAGPANRQGWVMAVAMLADGRVVTGGASGRVLVWDPAHPGAGPVELGSHDGPVGAAAVLADGRLVTGGHDRRVLVWDLAHPGAGPAELGRHDGLVEAMAVLADGRVVTGGNDDRVLVWDPAHPGTGPAEVGRHYGPVRAAAVLADGRVVTGGHDRRVLVWDLAHPGTGPAELGRHDGLVRAMAVLADGRVATGGDDDRRVLVWNPAHPGADPAELASGAVRAVAVLADGRAVTGGHDGRVLVWDLGVASTQVIQLTCSVSTLATARLGSARSSLVVAHRGNGFSLWSFAG
jgi:WD40 repeat protein